MFALNPTHAYPRCMYCQLTKCEPPSKSVQFNREHVIPQNATRRVQNNLVVKNTVCAECNHYFGSTLDVFTPRARLSAICKILFGSVPAQTGGDYIFSLPVMSLHRPIFDKMKLTLRCENGRTEAFIEPRNKIGTSKWSRLSKELKMLVSQDELNLCIQLTLEILLKRIAAKIAFNYLACALRQRPEFLCEQSFEPLRGFISGKLIRPQLVRLSPLTPPAALAGSIHYVKIARVEVDGVIHLKAFVNIFDVVACDVTLTDDPRIVNCCPETAHIWDLNRKQCLQLFGRPIVPKREVSTCATTGRCS